MHPIFQQTIAYGTVLLLAIIILSFLMRGFFWQFVRVKSSMGRLILVKIRAVNRDYYKVGHIEDNLLVYRQDKKNNARLALAIGAFYRSIGINMIDVDEKTGAVIMPDFKGVSTHDPIVFDHLLQRALYKPAIGDTEHLIKIAIGAAVVAGIIGLVCAIMIYYQGHTLDALRAACGAGQAGVPGVI